MLCLCSGNSSVLLRSNRKEETNGYGENLSARALYASRATVQLDVWLWLHTRRSGGFLPEYIETIAIPIFDNNTIVFDVERLLTQEVRSAFIGRGSYRVQTDPGGADATLTGVINDITITPASFTSDQQASRYIFTLTAAIEFTDLTTNEIVWDDQQLIFSDEYEVASGAGDVQNVSAFFGQQNNAVERIATDFAATVVSSILEAF
ncbi:MAG: hypothetical protein Ct9H300mP25_13110 [Acidobacteriota bacterium]|nr:MAG: hypothetical protein Ct9H300mP25_13110 [Acidobacteriota bacterium]